ncbi:MAG TPA: hypothetical protein VNO33_12415 [Kofleriaceae bacterium]|nr:hypothetical protein [Kofleriaceae bacterium]
MGRLTGERRAFAAALLAFYGFIYLLVALQPPPGWAACFTAMALVYGAGFFGLVAGYFWARWYAIGLGMSGLITAVFSVIQIGMEPVLLFYGATHGGVSLFLWGGGMSTAFDGRKEWRERFHLDENSTHKLGKSVIRLGISLPYIVLYALAPKDGAGETLFALLAGGLVLAGVVALFRLRTWGVAALAAGAMAMGASLVAGPLGLAPFGNGYAVNVTAAGAAGLLLVAAALVPFIKPVARFLRA